MAAFTLVPVKLPVWKARDYRRLHACLTMFWMLLSIPTLLWWKDSIAYVAWLSLYANFASHWSAWQASRAEENGPGDS